jgi:hypothetical protein
MIRMLAPLALAALALSGCTATGGFSLAGSALNGALAGIAPAITVEQILQQYATYHNLKVGLEQIEASGMVTTTTQTPVIVTGTPMNPVPTPVPPVPTPVPPSPTPTGGPTVTPNHR